MKWQTKWQVPTCIIQCFFFISITADVFVVYFGDRDSESLMPGLLYNPQIAAVTEHSELKELEKLDKVITCYNKLTITQREKIAEFIV